MISPTEMPTRETALPDRSEPVDPGKLHKVFGRPLKGPFPAGSEIAMFAMGCFWGSEQTFLNVPGVWVTSVGYSGGFTVNATYEDMKTGLTGHAEVVRMVFDPRVVNYETLLKLFWENHDPTEGMKQGVDVGNQYRSAIYYYNERQRKLAELSRDAYQAALTARGYKMITTEIKPAAEFYFAEEYHQAYFFERKDAYCHNGTGVICPFQPIDKDGPDTDKRDPDRPY